MAPRDISGMVALLLLASCRHAAPDRMAAGPNAGAPPAAARPAPVASPDAPTVAAPVVPVAGHAAGCAELRAGGVAVSLTYDDSLPSQLEIAAPDLARYRLAGTFFVEDVGADPAPWQALAAAGHELGSHTMNHPCPRVNSWVKPGLASED